MNKAGIRTVFLLLMAVGAIMILLTEGVRAQAVATSEALHKALNAAQPGAEIQLAAGDYGALSISGLRGTAQAPIVIRSADPQKPARLSRLELREGAYVQFENLVFDYRFASFDPANLRPFQVFASRYVSFANNLFVGDLADTEGAGDGFPTGFGLAVTSSTQITLDRNEIRDFYRGLVVFDVVDIKVVNNLVHAIRMDGMNFAQVENVLIENNEIRDFKRVVDSSDHADMIQFWTNRTERPSRNIVIRNNVLNSGKGAFTQSIFMRNDLVDRGLAGAEMFYQNVTIEENVIINAHLHGITLGETAGVRIKRNTLIHNAASDGYNKNSTTVWLPRIRLANRSKDVVISQNIMTAIDGFSGQQGWSVTDNVEIQDRHPHQKGFYDDIFLAARSGDPRNLKSFTYVNPEVAARAGAQRLRGEQKSDLGLMPVISVVSDTAEGELFLSAARSQLPISAQLDEAEIDWRLGGKQMGTAPELHLRNLSAGEHDLELRVTLPDGQTQNAHLSLNVKGDDILRYALNKKGITSFAGPEPKLLEDFPISDTGIAFGKGISAWEVRSEDMTGFFETPAFKLYLRMRLPHSRDNIGGELLRVHQTLQATLTGRGGLEIRFNTQDERVKLITTPMWRKPGDIVDLLLDYDSDRGTLEVYSDDKLISQARVRGLTAPRHAWGLGFGAHLNNRPPASGEILDLVLSAPQNSQFNIRP